MNDQTTAVKKLLAAAVCSFERRGRGDHEIWLGPISGRSFTADGAVEPRHTAGTTPNHARLDTAFWPRRVVMGLSKVADPRPRAGVATRLPHQTPWRPLPAT